MLRTHHVFSRNSWIRVGIGWRARHTIAQCVDCNDKLLVSVRQFAASDQAGSNQCLISPVKPRTRQPDPSLRLDSREDIVAPAAVLNHRRDERSSSSCTSRHRKAPCAGHTRRTVMPLVVPIRRATLAVKSRSNRLQVENAAAPSECAKSEHGNISMWLSRYYDCLSSSGL